MPAIRPDRWENLYKSIALSLESVDDFELIIVGPYLLPKSIEGVANIKYISDLGSPSRCFNIAIEHAEGTYITWGADDGLYVEGKLRKVLNNLIKANNNKKVIALSQMEDRHVYDKEFCRINKHDQLRSPFINDSFVLFPTAVMTTSFMREIGGLDCRFQGHAMAHIDLAIRAQTLGANVEFEPEICLKLSHMMGTSGDHAPIHHSQLQEDEPLFRATYSTDNTARIKAMLGPSNISNWKNQEEVWHWRFQKVNNHE